MTRNDVIEADAVATETVVPPVGAPTSIGSLPHADRDLAIDLVLDRTPELPTAPTCPNVEPLELMIPQAAWGIPGVEIARDGTISIADPTMCDPDRPLDDPELLGRPFLTWRRFLERIGDRVDPVNLKITGPITLGLCLAHAGLDADRAFRIAGRAVAQRATALLDLADRLAPGTPRILIVDEPGLVGGLRPSLELPGDDVIDLLSSVLAGVENRCLTGVHVCGPTDWRLVTASGPGLLSLPVGADITASAGTIATFLDRGGWIAWGAVATDGPLGEHPSLSWRQLSAQWCELVQSGCDPMLLRRQALITPVCGLAQHDENQADHVFDLLRQLSDRLQDQVMGIKLSVGA